MSGPNNKYREWILETIDSLRSRKARPDLERICRMVRRRHGSDPDRTRAELEKLIQDQTVLKVSYKGSISYRNAAKVQRKSRKKEAAAAAAAELVSNNNGDSALSLTDQEEDSGEPSPDHRPVKKRRINKSHGSGGGAAAEEDESGPPEVRPDTRDGEPSEQSSAACAGEHQQNAPLRPKLGLGRPASNLDLSERSLRLGADVAIPAKPLGLREIWGYLSGQERLSEEKVKAVMEKEVAVRGRLRRTRCGNAALPPRGARTAEGSGGRLAKDKKGWVGRDGVQSGGLWLGRAATSSSKSPSAEAKKQHKVLLKVVSIHEHSDKESLSGVDPIAMTGCSPPLGASPSRCNSKHVDQTPATPDQIDLLEDAQSGFNGVERKTEVGVSSCLLTPTASPRDNGLSEEPGMNCGVTNGGFIKMEGASGSPVNWTVPDVVSYFTSAGFPEQATAFGTQEIDGKSLLLMQRNDVLIGLSIKLGPALKIYEHHVKVLQKTHFDDDDCT
ncbi:sterile alpha motif domain-containing protein 1 [Nerophis ophidion]|uniref:sterile alpha motif domain-containing protein 1 n=1 Tax=Nerophis ophidion TaxID=159077 RepID=UPI002ADF557E|nr:sterile alpha motif domain-containing protein 1 [Nerophis ophidion]